LALLKQNYGNETEPEMLARRLELISVRTESPAASHQVNAAVAAPHPALRANRQTKYPIPPDATDAILADYEASPMQMSSVRRVHRERTAR
jgi:hypothetical protein